MESLGWDISLVEVVDVDVYMYVLVMTTVIYNSPHDLSHIVCVYADWNQYLGRSVIPPRAYIYIQLFFHKYSVHTPSKSSLPR